MGEVINHAEGGCVLGRGHGHMLHVTFEAAKTPPGPSCILLSMQMPLKCEPSATFAYQNTNDKICRIKKRQQKLVHVRFHEFLLFTCGSMNSL